MGEHAITARSTPAEPIVVESLHARIKTLEDEANRPKTFLEKAQKHGGPVALLIGIFLSVVTIVDTFFSKPAEEMRKAQIEFNDRIGAITKIRQDYVQLSLRDQNNAALIQATASILTPWIMSNIQSASLLLPMLGDRVGAPQLIVLTYEALSVGDTTSAAKFIDHAAKIEGLLPHVRADVLRYKARVRFLLRRPAEGRESFTAALKTINESTTFGVAGLRAMITADWLVGELAFGDCANAAKLTTDLLKHLDDAEVAEVQRAGTLSQLRTQLAQMSRLSDKRCAVPDALASRLVGSLAQ